jgi:hypothetical protein
MGSGSYMRYSSKHILACGCFCAAVLSSAACSPRRIPPLTVEDLMEDRVTLDGILMKCNQNPTKARNDSACENARIAIERLYKDVDPSVEKKRQEEFERAREQLRLAQEKMRQEQEAKTKVDAYSLPVVPVETQTKPPIADPQTKDDPQVKTDSGKANPPPTAGTTTPQ